MARKSGKLHEGLAGRFRAQSWSSGRLEHFLLSYPGLWQEEQRLRRMQFTFCRCSSRTKSNGEVDNGILLLDVPGSSQVSSDLFRAM
jgi:hypothetical protein